jgi:hypothetical protein
MVMRFAFVSVTVMSMININIRYDYIRYEYLAATIQRVVSHYGVILVSDA